MTRARCPWSSASGRPIAGLLPAAVAALLLASPAGAATLLRREAEIRIDGGGFTRIDTIETRLEDSDDAGRWSRYPIWLDNHISLRDCVAEVRDADGRVLQRVPRRKHERIESPGRSTYDSSWASIVPFSGLRPGQVVFLQVETRHEPYFPAEFVVLDLGEPQERLTVRVSGAPDLAWHLDGPGEPFRVVEREAGLEVTAASLPAVKRPQQAPASASGAVLRLAWGGPWDWPGVGRWYLDLTRDVPPAGEAVKEMARRLTADLATPRERLAALVAHVKRKIRYEDVEIGVGGYVPSPGDEVLARAWGDCKDKAELLRQMLAAVDIPSHLALLRTGSDGALDPEIATPFQFNHAILAVPASSVSPAEGDPVHGGYLLVDATWERGGVGWLPPGDRGRPVLVATPDGGELVAVPDDPGSELTTVDLAGEIDWLGDLTGRVEVLIQGARAVAWLDDLALREQGRTEEDLRSLVAGVLPGSRLSGMAWEEIAGDVPALRLTAGVEMDRLFRGEEGAGSLLARGQAPFPEVRLLAERTAPVTLRTGRTLTTWSLELPEDWCPVEPREDREENALGRVVSRVAAGPGESGLRVTRETEIRSSQVDPDAFDQLKALALADSRADRRRIRLRCQEPAGS